jgi:D-sedoheptulose 7-phosphate isomerase
MENTILNGLIGKYAKLSSCSDQIMKAFNVLKHSFKNKGKLMICGNGGSAADAEHIAGELLKGFMKKRPLNDNLKKNIIQIDSQRGTMISEKIQEGLPAIPLVSHPSIITAVSNDNDPRLIFAQQVISLGSKGDVLLGISTSGNAENIVCAMIAAKAMGIATIGLTGASGGTMKSFCDTIITVPATSTPDIQELHLPVYHALSRMLEDTFFKN